VKKRHRNPWLLILLTCTLAVPTVAQVMGIYGPNMEFELLRPAIAVGVLLGLAHLLLRPVLRLLFAPVGCLTFGLFGLVIDVALIYGCAALVDGFQISGLLYAVLTAILINAVCAVVHR